MTWVSLLLPDDVECLSKVAWWLWISSVAFAFLSGVFAIGSKLVERHRAKLIEVRSAQRRLGQTQRTELIYWLARQEIKIKVRVAVVPQNEEAKQFAQDLKEVLDQAGWLVEGVLGAEPSNVSRVGLLLAVKDGNAVPAAASALELALKAAGLEPTRAEKAALRQDEIELLIGHKS